MRCTSTFMLLCVGLSGALHEVYAQSLDDAPVYGPGVREVLNSVLTERARLHSWVFQAVLTKQDNRREDSVRSTVLSVYDSQGERLRFETDGETRTVLASSQELMREQSDSDRKSEFLARLKIHKCKSIIVKNRDYLLEWFGVGQPGGSGGATKHIQLQDKEETPLYLHSDAIDPQLAGVLDHGTPSLMTSLEACLRRFAEKAESVTLDSSSAPNLRVIYKHSVPHRRVLHIDADRGYIITKCDTFTVSEDGSELALPRTTSTADWRKNTVADDVWTPTAISWTAVSSDSRVKQTSINIEWKEVNPASFDDKLFDYRTYDGYWEGLSFLDTRGGKIVELEEKFIGKKFRKSPPSADPSTRITEKRHNWFVSINLGLVIAIVFVVMGLRHLRK